MPACVATVRTPLPGDGGDGWLLDWLESEECAAILAQRFEPETENPFADEREPDPEIDA